MTFDETKINEIYFKSKYVSGQALEVINDFTNNTYIIKGSTGIGGTTTILNSTSGHRLIISPNVGMIKSKQANKGSYKSEKQLFIYGNSTDNWKGVNDDLNAYDNVIINTTPNQIIKVKYTDPALYEQLTQIPVFVDEIHAYSNDADYRKEVGQFLELVFNEWRANFKLSTATPNYNYLDVPADKNVKFYKVQRANEPIKKLQLSNSTKDLNQFVYDEHAKGRLVVVFTNNIHHHIKFNNLRAKNLVGSTLETKLKPYKQSENNDLNDLYNETDVIICSSSFFAGYDITQKCSIVIISEQKNDAYKIHPNDIIQAYGRCRAGVHDALLINATATHNQNGNPITYPTSQSEITTLISNYETQLKYWSDKTNSTEWFSPLNYEQLTPQNYVNRAVILAPILNKIYDYQLYNKEVLKSTLEGYNFELSDYTNPDPTNKYKRNKTPFNERLTNLLNYDEVELLKDYNHIIHNLKNKNNKEGLFSVSLAFLYLTAYLIKKTNANIIKEKLYNKRVKANEFYKSMDLFIRSNVDTRFYNKQLTPQQENNAKRLYYSQLVSDTLSDIEKLTNDWQMLYAIYKVTNNIFDNEIQQYITFNEIITDVELYERNKGNKNRVRNVATQIIKRCDNNNIKLNDSEINKTVKTLKNTFKLLDTNADYIHTKTKKSMKNEMKNVLVYLLTNGAVNYGIEKRNREYNPLTQLSGHFRGIIPIKYISIDLASANPQICDSILGTSIGLNVYDNLMNSRNIDRNEAKEKFNSTLNNHRLNVRQAKKVYLDAGYPNDKALQLAKMTTTYKDGDFKFYDTMTSNEKILIDNYKHIIPVKNYRLHDALIVKYEDVVEYNIELPTTVKGYKYHVEVFNDSTPYTGATTTQNNGQMVENRYYI